MSRPVSSKKSYDPPTIVNLGKATDLTKGVTVIATPDSGGISK